MALSVNDICRTSLPDASLRQRNSAPDAVAGREGSAAMGVCFPARNEPAGQTPVMVHSLLVLALGVHRIVVEPTVVLPAPSKAVPEPRLTIW